MKITLRKNPAIIFIYGLIAVLCYLLSWAAKTDALNTPLQDTFVLLLAWVLPLAALGLGALETYRIFFRKDQLIFDDEGLCDDIGGNGRIEWSDVTKLQFVTGPGVVLLIVFGSENSEIARIKSLRASLKQLEMIEASLSGVRVEVR